LQKYLELITRQLNDEARVKSSKKASLAMLPKPTPWDGNAVTWTEFEVDVDAYLQLSEDKSDLFRVTWTMGFLKDAAKKFAKSYRATHPQCSFEEFIFKLKENFNVNAIVELSLQKTSTTII
jgi:hypothetical protein